MAKCSNCATDAKYEYRISAGLKVLYCTSHLPSFLNAQKGAGLLAITPEPEVVPESIEVEAPKVKKKASVPDASDS